MLEESALPSVSSDDDPLRHVNPTAMMMGADRGTESPTEFSLQVRNRSVSAPGEGGSPSIMDAQLAMSIRRYRGAIMVRGLCGCTCYPPRSSVISQHACSAVRACVVASCCQPFVPPWSLNVVLVDGEALHRRLGGRMLRKLGCSFVLCEAVHDVRAVLGAAAMLAVCGVSREAFLTRGLASGATGDPRIRPTFRLRAD